MRAAPISKTAIGSHLLVLLSVLLSRRRQPIGRRRNNRNPSPESWREANSFSASASTPSSPHRHRHCHFTEHFAPEVAQDILAVLVDAGYRPTLTGEEVCCGLTWISTGQLDEAARAGVPIVGIEPSRTAALRHDAVELLGTDAARRVAAATRTLAELLASDGDWTPPDLTGVEVVAQPHCHQHAVGGWDAEARLLADAGARVRRVGGCRVAPPVVTWAVRDATARHKDR
ncbi:MULTISPECIES: hypothetical protein [Streptomyces]|uniref:hypothetical protein n=1 Tax=Streptomyces TaxID=1883 RepID=UPI00324D5937